MKKITLLVSNRECESALKKLRQAGVLHIEHLRPLAGGDTSSLEEKLDGTARALDILHTWEEGNQSRSHGKPEEAVKKILSLHKEKQNVENRIPQLEQSLTWYDIWGDISSGDVSYLQQAGIFLKLYVCPKKEFKKLSQDTLAVSVKEKGNSVYAALVSYKKQEALPFSEAGVPQSRRQDIEGELVRSKARLDEIIKELTGLTSCSAEIIKYQKAIEKELEFNRVHAGMGKEEKFSYLRGFCPQEKMSSFLEFIKRQPWAYTIEEVDDPQDAPTLIKNPRWIEIIKPVFQFMGTVPGYQEFDISVWFLGFFSLFFAMLIGDAGYGLLFLVGTLFVKKKVPAFPREPFLLLVVLSVSTFIWGMLTGTWFGAEQIGRLPFLKELVVPKIGSFTGSPEFLMHICFFIGAVQLSIAHAMKLIRYAPDLRSVAQAGWIQITWGVFFIAGNLVLGKAFPDFARYLLMIGIGLVVLFSYPQKNIIKGILIGVANLPLSVISTFADTLSYLRLFAVGFASVMVAVSFNEMALGVGFNGVVSGFFAALILVLGHLLNIVLGLMSVLVHGIRLNMLEFSGHLDMEWTGHEYKPFQE